MRVLFLGGTGNISSDCAELLHECGHEIFVLSRGQRPVPPHYRALRADRKDLPGMRAALREAQPDVVLNFIGYDVSELEIDFALFQGRILQYVFISSATVYVKPPRKLPITEDSPLGNPCWEYAQKKLACEQWLLRQWEYQGFPVTIVRPSHTYSKLWVPNPVSSASFTFAVRLERGLPVWVPDNGESPWTLTAASDFAAGLGGLLGKAETIGQAFHITSDEVLTWNQIVAEIAAAVGGPSPKVVKVPTDFICQIVPDLTGSLKGDKAHPAVFDNSKIKRFVPEFVCRKPFRVGVRESVAWLRAHPAFQNLSPKVEGTIEKVLAEWEWTGQGAVRRPCPGP